MIDIEQRNNQKKFERRQACLVKLGHFRKAFEKIDTLEKISRVNMQMKSD